MARQESGRDLARDIKRKALKRKKTRIEEKLEQAKEKVTVCAQASFTQQAAIAWHTTKLARGLNCLGHLRLFALLGVFIVLLCQGSSPINRPPDADSVPLSRGSSSR